MTKKTIIAFLSIVVSMGFANVVWVNAGEVTGSLTVGVQSGAQGVLKAAPSVSPAAGTYTSTQSVSLTASGAVKICYTTDSSTPACATTTTCTTGTVYSSAISVSATTTIKSAGCYADLTTGPVATSTYTISSGGGGGGGSGAILPSTPVTKPVVTPPVTTPPVTTLPSTAAPVAVLIHDPSNAVELISSLGLTSAPSEIAKYKPLVKSDAIAFKVNLTAVQQSTIANFVAYGASTETIKLGAGERRAVVRDYLETVGRSEVIWNDVQRMSTGQKIVNRNLAKEQAQVNTALKNFKLMVGHAPNFKDAKEDLSWNTLMYRIRFPRDLKLEKQGIVEFKSIYNRAPSTPLEWSIVRALGYVLK